MDITVNLYDQPCAEAEEIGDAVRLSSSNIMMDRFLSIEFQSIEAPTPKRFPQDSLGLGGFCSQIPRKLRRGEFEVAFVVEAHGVSFPLLSFSIVRILLLNPSSSKPHPLAPLLKAYDRLSQERGN